MFSDGNEKVLDRWQGENGGGRTPIEEGARRLPGTPGNGSRVEALIHGLLAELGEDPQREGLRDTPARIARMYDELLSGYQADADTVVNGALFNVDHDNLITVTDIDFYSMCEHHMLPFFGKVHVAYVPGEKVIGLSKIPRIVEIYARRLQIQERLGQEIAHRLVEILEPRGVAVVIEAMHLCTAMRGVRQDGARMRTRALRGAFEREPDLRADFLRQVGGGHAA